MTTVRRRATDLSYRQIAQAIEFTNVCSYIRGEYEAWLEAQGLTKQEYVAMATHSCGQRSWTLACAVRLEDVPYFDEKAFSGGWYHFREQEVVKLESASATSGSRLIAVKKKRGWELRLEVPATPKGDYLLAYTGAYWAAYHRATGQPEEAIEPPSSR